MSQPGRGWGPGARAWRCLPLPPSHGRRGFPSHTGRGGYGGGRTVTQGSSPQILGQRRPPALGSIAQHCLVTGPAWCPVLLQAAKFPAVSPLPRASWLFLRSRPWGWAGGGPGAGERPRTGGVPAPHCCALSCPSHCSSCVGLRGGAAPSCSPPLLASWALLPAGLLLPLAPQVPARPPALWP